MQLVYLGHIFGSLFSTYTAKRLAGPSKTAVSPSIVTTPASLPAYLESALLYSFPVIGSLETFHQLKNCKKLQILTMLIYVQCQRN